MNINEKLNHNSRIRLLIQAISFALHNGYVRGWMKAEIYQGDNKKLCVPGLNCYSCPGAVGSCPIGSLQAVLDSGQYRFSCYVLGFIGLMGMVFGRFICGWLCPFGFIQDLIHRIPIGRKIKNLPGHKYLTKLRYVILIFFVILLPMLVVNVAGTGQPWFCEYICPSGTLLGGIPLVLTHENLQAMIGIRFFWKLFLLLLFLAGALVSVRPFCKYVCPLGALYGLCNPVSVYRLKIRKDSCIECGACQQACGMDIPVWQKPNSTDCIRCLKCKAACPTGSITSTFEDLRAMLQPLPSAGEDTDNMNSEPMTSVESEKPDKRSFFGKCCHALFGILGILIALNVLIISGIQLEFSLVRGGLIDGTLDFLGMPYYMFLLIIPNLMGMLLSIRLLLNIKNTSKDAELRQWALWTILSLPVSMVLLAAGNVLINAFENLSMGILSVLWTGQSLLLIFAGPITVLAVIIWLYLGHRKKL